MENMKSHRRAFPLPVYFVGGVALTMGLTLAIFARLMNPPLQDFGALAAYLSITAALSIAVGHVAYRWNWLNRSPRLSLVLLGSYAISSVLTFINVWVTAALMFLNRHDLILGTVLLIFAGGIAMSLGYFLSTSLTDRIVGLNRAAQEIARGHLDARVSISGRDELANLAGTFNEMAMQLEAAERKQRELDSLRRDLVAWVGHDLRTPLTSVRLIVEALADDVVQDRETIERYLETAQQQIQNLSFLLDDLVELAQIDAGGLTLVYQPNSLCDLISDTLEAFSAQALRQGVTLEGSVNPDVDPVPMDVQKVGRVLNNLLDNAMRYTPPGGKVKVSAAAERNCIRVEVCDTGEGIDTADLPHIFERFYRGEKSRSRATGGSGLGLAIASGIVAAHGGQVGVEDMIDQGTRIWFTLPV